LNARFLKFLFAMHVCKNTLKQRKVVIHTDNGAVRECFISCHATKVNALPSLEACTDLECDMAWNAWIARVPKKSNVADDPSRFFVKNW
jgi:hypothetical protein